MGRSSVTACLDASGSPVSLPGNLDFPAQSISSEENIRLEEW
jgi:hypothetical protein